MALDHDIALLSRLPLIGRFEVEALRLLAFSSETRILKAGDVLFRRGDESDGGYVVVSGSIAMDSNDDGSAGAYIVSPGALIGELALFVSSVRPATAIAREASTVMKLPAKVMARVLAEFPSSARTAHSAIATRVRALSNDIAGVRAQLIAIDEPASKAKA
jgi:CRP-like cAMP-binding protein